MHEGDLVVRHTERNAVRLPLNSAVQRYRLGADCDRHDLKTLIPSGSAKTRQGEDISRGYQARRPRQTTDTKCGPPGISADYRCCRNVLLINSVISKQGCFRTSATRATRHQQRKAPAGAPPARKLEQSRRTLNRALKDRVSNLIDKGGAGELGHTTGELVLGSAAPQHSARSESFTTERLWTQFQARTLGHFGRAASV